MKSLSYNEAPKKNAAELITMAEHALKRYWRIALGPAVVFFGLVVTFSLSVPDYHTADSLLFIQPQRIQTKIVRAPNEREMRARLESLVQEILSRPRLRAVIEKFNLYPSLRGPQGMEHAVVTLRKKIDIVPVHSPTGLELLQTFRLTFTHGDAQTAYQVTQAITNLFIEESLIERRSEIQSTEEFLDAELHEARRKLEETESKVQGFVRDNFKQLPEHLDAAIARLDSLQAQMSTNGQLITANSVRKQNLQSELVQARQASPIVDNITSSNPREAIEQLESALVVLKSKYSDQHPDVIKTTQRIAALRAQLESGQTSARGRRIATPRVQAIRLQLNEVNARLAALEEENAALKKSIDTLQADIQAMPLKEQELLKIRRDYANVKANYERLLVAKEEASLQNSLVRSQKASQFRVIEPAELPAFPAGPNRKLFLIAGGVFATAVFVSLLFVLYFLNGAYKDRDDVETNVGLPVLGIVPPMPTPEAIAYDRRLSSVSLFATLLSIATGSVLIMYIINKTTV